MAKTAVGKVAEVAAEQQTHKLIRSAVARLEKFASGIAEAATAGAKRKYVIAGLAALIVAGRAAEALRSSMAAKKAAKRKRTRKKAARKRRSR